MGQRDYKKKKEEGQKETHRVSFRFTKDEHIRKRNDFIRVYTEGSRYFCPEFAGFWLKTGKEVSRLGMSVGKAIGGSVVRNKLKRCIREIFRLNKHNLTTGYDIIISPRKGCDKIGYHNLERAMLKFFCSTGLMK